MEGKPNFNIINILIIIFIISMIIVNDRFNSVAIWIPISLIYFILLFAYIRILNRTKVKSLTFPMIFLLHFCITSIVILLLFLLFSQAKYIDIVQLYLTFFIIFIIGIILLTVFTKRLENYFTFLNPKKSVDKLVNLTTMLSIIVTALVLTRTTFLTIYTTEYNKDYSKKLSEVEYIESYLYHSKITPSNTKYKVKLESNTIDNIDNQLNVLKEFINNKENYTEKENSFIFNKSFSQFLSEKSIVSVQLKEEGDNKELAERVNEITNYLLNGKKDASFLTYSKRLKLSDSYKFSESSTPLTDFSFFIINIIIYTLNIYYLFLSLTKDVTFHKKRWIKIHWNPKIATIIFLTLVLCIPTIIFIYLYLPKEFLLFIVLCFIIFIFDVLVEGFIFNNFKSNFNLHISEILNQLIICFFLTFIPWGIVLIVLDIFSVKNLDRTQFTLFIGVCFILTVLFYTLLKKVDIFTRVDNLLCQIFNLNLSTSQQKKSQLDISLLGQIADIFTFLITVLLLANSAYTAIESSFNSTPIKTKDLGEVSEYLYLIPGIAIYSLATYYKIKDFLLKTKNKVTM